MTPRDSLQQKPLAHNRGESGGKQHRGAAGISAGACKNRSHVSGKEMVAGPQPALISSQLLTMPRARSGSRKCRQMPQVLWGFPIPQPTGCHPSDSRD